MKKLILSRAPRFTNFLRLHAYHARNIFGVDPDAFEPMMRLWRVLANDYGFSRSFAERSCRDGAGNPIPWYTYPAIEFLSSLSFEGKRVFEYGCGASTDWWSRRAAAVYSVETERDWFETVLKWKLPGVNVDYGGELDPEAYAATIRRTNQHYDVIVVDGQARDHRRMHCSREAAQLLKPGGMIILDNSDRLPYSTALLVELGFTEIPFNGFTPLNDAPGRTSIFFRGSLEFQRLPHRFSTGGKQEPFLGESGPPALNS